MAATAKDQMYISLNERDGKGGLQHLGVYIMPRVKPPQVVLKGNEVYTPRPWADVLVGPSTGSLDRPYIYVKTSRFMLPAGAVPVRPATGEPVEFDTRRYFKGEMREVYTTSAMSVLTQSRHAGEPRKIGKLPELGMPYETQEAPAATSPRAEWAKNSGGYDKDKFNHGS